MKVLKLICFIIFLVTVTAYGKDLPKCNSDKFIQYSFGVQDYPGPEVSAYDVDDDNFPRGLTLDKQGNIYVGDGVNYSLYKFDSKGQLIWQTKLQPAGTDEPEQGHVVSAVAVAPGNKVLVWNRTNQRIEVYSSEGKYTRQFNVYVGGAGQPTLDELWATKTGEIYACHNIGKFCGHPNSVYGIAREPAHVFSLEGKLLKRIRPQKDATARSATSIISPDEFIGAYDFALSVRRSRSGLLFTVKKGEKIIYNCMGDTYGHALIYRFDRDGTIYVLEDDGVTRIKPDYQNAVLLSDLPHYRKDGSKKQDYSALAIDDLIYKVLHRKIGNLSQEKPEVIDYLKKQKPAKLRLLRNAYFAKNYYKFKNPSLIAYYQKLKPDYVPKWEHNSLGVYDREDVLMIREIEENILGKSLDEAYLGAKSKKKNTGKIIRETIDLTKIKGDCCVNLRGSGSWTLHFPPSYTDMMTGVNTLHAVYSPEQNYVLLHGDNKGTDNKDGTNLWVKGLNKNTWFEMHTNKYRGLDLMLNWLDEYQFTVTYRDSETNTEKTDTYYREHKIWYKKATWKLSN